MMQTPFKFDNFSQARERKVVALALASLINTTKTVILERFSDIVNIWTSVLAETEETQDGE